jgi:hypothetical protein
MNEEEKARKLVVVRTKLAVAKLAKTILRRKLRQTVQV